MTVMLSLALVGLTLLVCGLGLVVWFGRRQLLDLRARQVALARLTLSSVSPLTVRQSRVDIADLLAEPVPPPRRRRPMEATFDATFETVAIVEREEEEEEKGRAMPARKPEKEAEVTVPLTSSTEDEDEATL